MFACCQAAATFRIAADSELDDEVLHDAEERHTVEEVCAREVVEAIGAARRPGAMHRHDERALRRLEGDAIRRRRLGMKRLRMEQLRRCGRGHTGGDAGAERDEGDPDHT
jgi:hypothetical protein